MSLCEEYFPTRAYTNAVNRLGLLLSKERDRLDDLARTLLEAAARHDFADSGASSGDQDGIALNFHGSKNTQSTRALRANVVNSTGNVVK